jgi:hypothetical protein
MATKKKSAKFKFVKPKAKPASKAGRPRQYNYDLAKIMKYLEKDTERGAKMRASKKFGIPYNLLNVQLGRFEGKW